MISDTLSEAHHAIRRYLNSSWGRKAYEPLRELLLVEMNEIRKILDTPTSDCISNDCLTWSIKGPFINNLRAGGLALPPLSTAVSAWSPVARSKANGSPAKCWMGPATGRLVLKTKDDALIGMTYQGLRHGPPDVIARIEKGEVVDPTSYYFRINPLFETAAGQYDWINRVIDVGIGHRFADGPVYSVFEIL
jgi:Protein of unknown function (DUF3237)